MIPAAMQSFGGQLYYVRGGKITPLNLEFVSDPTLAIAAGGADPTKALTSNFNAYFFGGRNTYWPAGYANLKPMAFYHGKLYMALNYAREGNGHLYVGRWDGSGIFNHGGSAYGTSKDRSGRGFELLSPSGTATVNNRTKSGDLGLLVYNDILFMYGQYREVEQSATSAWLTKFKWNYRLETITGSDNIREARRYRTIAIEPNGKRTMSKSYRFLPNATIGEHLLTCDAIGYNDSIYFANWIDTVKVIAGSGNMTLIESDLNNPSAKCFHIWPTSGYSNGLPVGQDTLLMLTGSGVLKKINEPSGTTTLIDLDSLSAFTNRRIGDNWFARINSASLEPGRSCLLSNYDKKLHAFITTATSGYRHFKCDGDPTNTENWKELTRSLPENIRDYDGNLYGFVDEFRDKLYVAHTNMSKVGVWGHQGIQNGAGGISIFELSNNDVWQEIYTGLIGMSPRGLIPYMNYGPYITIPSGNNPEVLKCNDYAIIEYKAYDHFRRLINVNIEFSINNGLSWSSARRFKSYLNGQLLGSGIINLPTSPEGLSYNFYWDYVNDFNNFNELNDVLIRIRPKLVR